METYVKTGINRIKSETDQTGTTEPGQLSPVEVEFRDFIRSQLHQLVELLTESDVDRLKVKTDEVGVDIARKRKFVSSPMGLQSSAETAFKPVVSKFLGILHLNDERGVLRVKKGDPVKKDQVLATVETMNIFNEIKAPRSGIIEEILEEDGRPVEYGQVIFLIKPN